MLNSHQQHPTGCGHGTHRGWGWIPIVFALIGGILLWQDHRAHMLGVLPYLILLACPLMHLLHRRGRGHHGDHDGSRA